MRRAAAILVVPILVVTAWPMAAHAADCSNAGTQSELNDCAYKDFQKADAVLNQVYAKLKARTSAPDAVKRLVEAEKAWIAYRDRECDFETEDSIDGSIRPMELSACYQQKTTARTAELKKQLDCPEGDLTCAH